MLRSALAASAALLLLVACRGERPPRDYQNSPPAMTHPPTTSSQTPAANGMPGAAPEPSTGAEGKNLQRKPVTLGVRTPGFVEIASGVQPGEQVVVGGLELLQPGMPVRPTVVTRVRRDTTTGDRD